MCTASRIDRGNRQRLRGKGKIATSSPGSFGLDPRALRPERLQCLGMVSSAIAKSLAPAQIAASPIEASAHQSFTHIPTAARAGAMTGASPPFLSLVQI
jgi:hypothetical protein